MLLNEERFEEKMAENGLDALVATSPANVFYTSDLCPYGNCYTLLPSNPNTEPAIIAPVSGPAPIALMSPPWISDVRYYGEFYTTTEFAKEPLTKAEGKLIEAQESWEASKESNPISLLIDLLKEKDITKGRVGVDETNLPPEHPFWLRVKTDLPNLEAVPAKQIFSEIRAVKSDEEIKRIKEAIRITEKAWKTSLEQAREGMTEREFGDIYQHTIISEGGRITSHMGYYGPPVAFGRRTAYVDIAFPSDYALQKGDIIRFDGGGNYLGYPCDMARSAVVGELSEKLRKYWKALFEGESLAIQMAQPGIKASDIFKAVMDKVRKSGIEYYKRHHTGHGWGIEGYDPPLISPSNHTKLEEGMVLCFETPYYEVGWGGLLHEDIVVITKDGARYLTTYEDELRII
jgi:Xaa-Pro aminopeptidase